VLAGLGVVLAMSRAPSGRLAHPVQRSVPSIANAVMPRPGAGGVFAAGTAQGRPWQLAVQDIADPGYRCVPGVTLDRTDAVPVFPDPDSQQPAAIGNAAFITLGSGVGFAFIQVPVGVDWVWLDPGGVYGLQIAGPPVTVTACGERFRLAGFAYPLTGTLRITEDSPTLDYMYTVPTALTWPQPSLAQPQVDGVWQDMDAAHAQVLVAPLAAGHADGGSWAIRLMFGTTGDCFTLNTSYLNDTTSANAESVSACGPVSTPPGTETIMVLPLALPAADGQGTGYAISLGPAITRLTASLSDGSSLTIRPVTAGGRKYAAFFVADPAHLDELNWYNLAGQRIAQDTAIPDYGYTQFQP
jgi:hypothetical protein